MPIAAKPPPKRRLPRISKWLPGLLDLDPRACRRLDMVRIIHTPLDVKLPRLAMITARATPPGATILLLERRSPLQRP